MLSCVQSQGMDFDVDSFLYSLTIHCCHLPGNFGKNIKERFSFFFPIIISKLLLSWRNHLLSGDVVQHMFSVVGCCTVHDFCCWKFCTWWVYLPSGMLSSRIFCQLSVYQLWHCWHYSLVSVHARKSEIAIALVLYFFSLSFRLLVY